MDPLLPGDLDPCRIMSGGYPRGVTNALSTLDIILHMY